MKPDRLIPAWCFCALVFALSAASAAESPFSQPIDAERYVDKNLSPQQVRVLLAMQLESLPYQLAQYARTGNDLVLQSLQDASSAVERYIKRLGESIGNSRDKETFAKLHVGVEHLQQNLVKTVSAVREHRRARTVFDFRIERLVEWLDLQIIDRIRSNPECPDPAKPGLLNSLRSVRVELLGTPSAMWLPFGTAGSPEARDRTVERLETARSIAERLPESVSSDAEKRLAHDLAQSVDVLSRSAQDLFLRIEELRQSWDDTMAALDSMKAVITFPTGARPSESRSPDANTPGNTR